MLECYNSHKIINTSFFLIAHLNGNFVLILIICSLKQQMCIVADQLFSSYSCKYKYYNHYKGRIYFYGTCSIHNIFNWITTIFSVTVGKLAMKVLTVFFRNLHSINHLFIYVCMCFYVFCMRRCMCWVTRGRKYSTTKVKTFYKRERIFIYFSFFFVTFYVNGNIMSRYLTSL